MTRHDHVVSITDMSTGEEKFLSYESGSGYLMGTTRLSNAAFFTEEEAIGHMKLLQNEKVHVTTDGTVYPPDFIQRGFEMSYSKPKASGFLAVKKVELVTVDVVPVEGEIKKPTGFKYD